jgi:hypothetical protein
VVVGGVVVADHMQVLAGPGGGDLVEEAQELLVAVARVAGVHHLPGRYLQGGEQGGDAVADVVVGGAFGQARPDGQDGLGPVQRLDLALLIHAHHDRVLGRVQVQTHHIGELGC